MNLRPSRDRTPSLIACIAALGLLLVSILAIGGASASARDTEAVCIYYAGPNGHPIELYATDPRCPQQAAINAAAEEAAGWPDYDPTRAYDEGKIEMAIAEAEGWPNYDPTLAIEQADAIEAAAIEAAAWPNYDPTNVQDQQVITIADAPRGATVLQ